MAGNTIDALNRLLVIHYRSLPMYLSEAAPWTNAGDAKAEAALAQITADQRRTCERLAEAVLERDGTVDAGRYPMEYTDTHFLALDYLISELIEAQRTDIQAIEACVRGITQDAAARDLAEESLGAAKAHLEALEELAGRAR